MIFSNQWAGFDYFTGVAVQLQPESTTRFGTPPATGISVTSPRAQARNFPHGLLRLLHPLLTSDLARPCIRHGRGKLLAQLRTRSWIALSPLVHRPGRLVPPGRRIDTSGTPRPRCSRRPSKLCSLNSSLNCVDETANGIDFGHRTDNRDGFGCA